MYVCMYVCMYYMHCIYVGIYLSIGLSIYNVYMRRLLRLRLLRLRLLRLRLHIMRFVSYVSLPPSPPQPVYMYASMRAWTSGGTVW
jgi:hypothetical protein